jgi:hypothetical protein
VHDEIITTWLGRTSWPINAGEEHPNTLTAWPTLLMRGKGQGRDKATTILMDKCAQLRTRILGASHPHTRSSSEVLTASRLEGLTLNDGLVVAHVN